MMNHYINLPKFIFSFNVFNIPSKKTIIQINDLELIDKNDTKVNTEYKNLC